MRRPLAISTFIWLSLLGAFTTLAVAVACSYFPANSNGQTGKCFIYQSEVFNINETRGFGVHHLGWNIFLKDNTPSFALDAVRTAPHAPPPWWTDFWTPGTIDQVRRAQSPTGGAWPTQNEVGAGWPFIALHGYVHATPVSRQNTPNQWVGVINAGDRLFPIGPNSSFSVERRIPFLPAWRGLIADVALYACIWWLILTFMRRLRGVLRRGRGLCPHCAYDLRATPSTSACPECGRASARRYNPGPTPPAPAETT